MSAVPRRSEVTKKIEYTLAYQGVFGRNRASKLGTAPLLRVDLDASVDLAALERAARTKLTELRAKPGLRWSVDRIGVEETLYEDGVKIDTFTFELGHVASVLRGVV